MDPPVTHQPSSGGPEQTAGRHSGLPRPMGGNDLGSTAMNDVENQTFAIASQRSGEEEKEYGPEVPLETRLRLELDHLHA